MKTPSELYHKLKPFLSVEEFNRYASDDYTKERRVFSERFDGASVLRWTPNEGIKPTYEEFLQAYGLEELD